MIKLIKGNILKAETEAIVNTVNCVGVMGRGIALQFKKAFPENYKLYEAACSKEEVKPGEMFIYDSGNFINPRYIINFPTKRHWKGKSRMADIDSGLEALVSEVEKKGIKSISIPPLGCGLGGLAWSEVFPRIKKAFSEHSNIDVHIYEPSGAPIAADIAKNTAAPNMTVGRAALIALMRRYLSAVMDPVVSLLEIQKLMYFMQESGEPLRLKYAKANYGPYASNLSHVLHCIEGHFISGYLDGGDAPDKPIELKQEAITPAETFLKDHNDTLVRFERVNDLIQGFETSYGMELLSTVHWVAKNNGANTPESATENIYAWNARKRMFPKEHISLALNILKKKNWI